MQQAYTLALELASFWPNFAVVDRSGKITLQRDFPKKEDRYDAANFIDCLAESFEELGCNVMDVGDYIFCDGPGAFSPLRCSAVIGKILSRLNPNANIWGVGLLQVLYCRANLENPALKTVYLSAGLSGYHRQDFDPATGLPLCTGRLCNQITGSPGEFVLVDKTSMGYEQLASTMCSLLRYDSNRIKRLNHSAILPNYGRPASTTASKPKESP